ncbi:uncharacterized protein LOC101847372 [Aplysia californica]|uniref:Uncharacterized protein LOC101847372 n=1 Tax=Aplysia californica TaxID=6500 RepID=A0ABM1W0S6_APLCA|nr:uncharacterized protein LOC101847372 [Aplysia californica]XP_035828268.1 uncharacterized protein LOC101847372 [Aplysia californica]XP_035828269.1 uncharacterized protein LOC101847372 [Aplysia californica]
MDSDEPQKGKRGRKRQNDEESLTGEELKKKQKNRDAAKKCRQKKVKEAEDLKQRNNQLENENEDLSKRKIHLEEEVNKLSQIIRDHMKRGCQLPVHVRSILENSCSNSTHSHLHDASAVQPTVTAVPQNLPESDSFTSKPPAAVMLFSGKPIQEGTRSRPQQSVSIVRSPSSQSPSPRTVTPNQGVNQGALSEPGEQLDLSDFLMKGAAIPQSGPLAPVRHIVDNPPRMQLRNQYSSESSSSAMSIPSVVYEENDIDETSVSHQMSVRSSGLNMNELMNRALRKSREEPGIEAETHTNSFYDQNVENYGSLYNTDNVTNVIVSDGVQQIVVGGSSINPSYMENQVVPGNVAVTSGQNIVVQRMMVSGTPQPSADNGSLNISTAELLAPALLNISPSEMSPSLQQQIKSNYSTSSRSSVSSSPSLSLSSQQIANTSATEFQVDHSQSEQISQHAVYAQSPQDQMLLMQQQQQQPVQTVDVPMARPTQNQSASNVQNSNKPLIVKKDGNILVLEPKPNGKHLVHHLKGKELVNTGIEVDIKRNHQGTVAQTELQTASVPHVVNGVGMEVTRMGTQSVESQPNSAAFVVNSEQTNQSLYVQVPSSGATQVPVDRLALPGMTYTIETQIM